MITISPIKIIEEQEATGLRVELPEAPPLLLIVAEKGFVMCGYLNLEAAERVGACAATVSGVKSLEDVLEAEVKAVTTKAQKLGIRTGIKGKQALKIML